MDGVGDILAKNLITYCGSVEAVFKLKKSSLTRIPGIGQKAAESIVRFNDYQRIEQEVKFIEKHRIKPLFYTDKEYPLRLKSITDAPILIYTLGNLDLNAAKTVGIVGTRRATEYGKLFTEELVAFLKPLNCLVVSGLAYGIDVFAHKSAIANQLPTVGVMAHGLDRIYPGAHQKTARQMLEHGGLVTEFPSTTNPDKENFPRRNRIVAGLSDVLVVVETPNKGGAMITADIANSYNKDIMALPGRVGDEFSVGCNTLIKQNKAAIITKPEDLTELMNWDLEPKKKRKLQTQLFDLDETDSKVVGFIRQMVKAGIDDISISMGMDSGEISLRLLDLEFRNIIRTLPGKYYELQSP